MRMDERELALCGDPLGVTGRMMSRVETIRDGAPRTVPEFVRSGVYRGIHG
jgi:hypothetical protein